MDKLRIRQAIVVEGKYDQNALRQLVDTAIFTTNGFTGMKRFCACCARPQKRRASSS